MRRGNETKRKREREMCVIKGMDGVTTLSELLGVCEMGVTVCVCV